MKGFDTLIENCQSVDWNDFEGQHLNVEGALTEVSRGGVDLSGALHCIVKKSSESFFELSKERTTHFKWFVYKDAITGFRIWFHQYKAIEERRVKAYAEVPHNHLYWFSSVVICGGLRHRTYSVADGASEGNQLQQLDEENLFERAVYSVSPDTFHELQILSEPTVTLVVQSPDLKNFSDSIDFSGLRRRHYRLQEQFRQFGNELQLVSSPASSTLRKSAIGT